ncbi:MAG: hypothetical protein NC078_07415 [Ruminococcus sp.]|nr:hypothetical protein [Ruminococcus sp.]
MKLYGSELVTIGIILITAAFVYGVISLCIHLALSSRLKKKLEKEYGSEKIGGDTK